jgi:hypothetical protein
MLLLGHPRRTCLGRSGLVCSIMSTVAEIKEAIAKLSPDEYCELMAELHPPLPDDEWDKQMKADAAAGRFDEMNRRAEKDFKAGRCDSLERMFKEEK